MRKRKAEGAESRSESQPGRVRLQPAPRGPGSDDGSAASPNVQRYPGGEAVPRPAPGAVGASQQADAVYAADPRRGHRRIRPRRHREALTHGRPGGRSTPSPRNKLPRWLSRVLHFTRVLSIGREEAFREQRIGRPVGGWRRALGGGREGSSSPERLRAHILAPPDAESGMVTQSIDLAGFRIRVDRPRLAVSSRDWGAFTSRT